MICRICGGFYRREDTDLCPKCGAALEQLRIKDRDRFLELMSADRDGRLVVLPCKVGDTVYRVLSVKDGEPVIVPCEIKTVGQAADLAGRIGKKGWIVSTYLSRQEAEEALREEADHA